MVSVFFFFQVKRATDELKASTCKARQQGCSAVVRAEISLTSLAYITV